MPFGSAAWHFTRKGRYCILNKPRYVQFVGFANQLKIRYADSGRSVYVRAAFGNNGHNKTNSLGTGGIGGGSAALFALCSADYEGEIPAGSIREE